MYAKELLLFAVLVLPTHPDEGQWLPSQLRAMDWHKLAARGLKLTRDQFWNPDTGGLLNAAVQLGGCTAAFVSPRGLVLTNHHCGDEAIAQLSSLQRNYLKEGFVARSRQQEQPTHLELYVVRQIEDVSARVHAAQKATDNPLQRYDATQAAIRTIVEEAERDPETGAKNPRTTCMVASFFEGREYLLYYRTRITDVRLVYAPPAATADYGGNVDNWEWPRHSGDFVFFRAYVAPDGTPRAYDPENVPFEPSHYLRPSAKGASENDLVLIFGYPGRTERYLTSVAVQQWQGLRFPRRRMLFAEMLDILEEAADTDPAICLKLSSTINSFANIEKHDRGMVAGLQRNGVVDRKIREEAAFLDWARRSGRTDGADALHELLALDHAESDTLAKDQLLSLLRIRRVRDLLPLLTTVTELVRSAKVPEEGEEPSYSPELLASIGAQDATRDLDLIQRPLLELVLDEIRNLPEDQQMEGAEVLGDSDVTADDMVGAVLAATTMTDPAARLALLRQGRQAVQRSDDPLVVLARGLVAETEAFEIRERTDNGRRMVVGPRWIEAQQAWRGKSFYPDANSTLRISIAQVKGYSPRDAVDFRPFSTVAGMLEKLTGKPPFQLPDALQRAAHRRWLSRFLAPGLDDVPVCFLADGDTTNGNSGSPVINGEGELVGLNFDRVFENVACDFGWDPDRSRNISLDIRFVLWHLESVMPAPRLLREMGLR